MIRLINILLLKKIGTYMFIYIFWKREIMKKNHLILAQARIPFSTSDDSNTDKYIQ